ncbi:MAG: hypothetical protein M3281_10285 [Chloroflexota bacterium]|nr:hypothetical protein [Chloroflexota bacterium]
MRRRTLLASCVAGLLGSSFALFLLTRAPAYRLVRTPVLDRWPQLGRLWDLLTPASLLAIGWDTDAAAALEYVYLLLVLVTFLLWLAALWLLSPGKHVPKLRWILIPALIIGQPLLLLPALFSGDLYLYIFYGRIISAYGENPFLMAPNQFASDPFYSLVIWHWLPSAYGPVWLLVSGALSAIAGDSLLANVLVLKSALLGVHVLTVVLIWRLLRVTRPELAPWGAVFYGWNPLVLIETAGNGHNEALLCLFIVLCMLSVVRRRWAIATVFLVTAAMVKPIALLLFPALMLAWARSLTGAQSRARALGTALVTAVITGLILYAPLWAGLGLLSNILANPAVQTYENSLWKLLASEVVTSGDKVSMGAFRSDLDIVRNCLLAASLLWLLWRLWRGACLLDTWIWSWAAFCLCAAWIWPWYFLPAIAIGAVRGPSRVSAVAAGLALGGMLFWLGWPEPTLPSAPYFHDYRSVLLFSPALLTAAWAVLPRRCNGVRAARRR